MKPNRKWVGLGCAALLGVTIAGAWDFYGRVIAPMKRQEAEALRTATEFRERIGSAHKTIAETRALEQEPDGARSRLHALESGRRTGAAVVWFPDRIAKHFERMGLAGAVARLNTTLDEPELPDFERTFWAVEVPAGESVSEFRELCIGIAEIEPVDPSIHVLDVAIHHPENETAQRRLVMNVSVLSQRVKGAK